MHILGWIVLLITFLTCVLPLGLAWYFQERLIFIPQVDNLLGPLEPGFKSPAEWHLPHEDIYTKADNGDQIHAWLMKQKDSAIRPTIVFFHGNAGTIERRLPFYSLLYNALRVNVVASSYRGYGQSTGSPGEKEFNEDGQKLIQLLSQRSDLDATKLIVYGRSIGGAVAVDVALNCPQVRAVIVENTFWSLEAIATEVYRPLAYIGILGYLLRHKFETGAKIDKIKQSIMFISGDSDELVPPSQMRNLGARAQSAKSRAWLLVGQGTHNETWLVHQKGYVQAVKRFLEAVGEGTDTKDFEIEIGSPKGPEAQSQPSFAEKVSTIFRAEPAPEKKEL